MQRCSLGSCKCMPLCPAVLSTLSSSCSWASAHRGKWGQLTPWKNGRKIKKRKHVERAVFYIIFWEQSGQAGVEHGDILTTYLFRYRIHCTSECTISYSQFFIIFFASGRKGALTPLTRILRTFLCRYNTRHRRKPVECTKRRNAPLHDDDDDDEEEWDWDVQGGPKKRTPDLFLL